MSIKQTPMTPNSPYTPSGELPIIYVPVPSKQRRPRRGWRIVGALLLLAITAVLGLGLALSFYAYQADLIMPGVQALGVPLGTQSRAEAAQTLQAHWQQQTIVLTTADIVHTASPPELGITLNVDETVQHAYDQGRSFDSLIDVVLHGNSAVAPVWQMDTTAAENFLYQVAPEFETPTVNASVRIVNGQAEAVPAQTGHALNVPATMTWFTQHGGEAVLSGRLPLVMETVEPTVFDASNAVAQVNQLLTLSLQVQAYDAVQDETVDWSIPAQTWGDWVAISPLQPGQVENFDWTVDEEKVAAALATNLSLSDGRFLHTDDVAAAITRALLSRNSTVSVRIFHPERTHIVQSGDTLSSIGYQYGVPYPWLQQLNPGLGNVLTVGQSLTIPSPDDLLPLPVVQNKRVVVSLSQQRAWVYENGAVKWEWPASTGIASSPTSPGIFQIQSHESNAYAGNWDLWMPSFMGIYRPVPTSDFMNGFHGFPTRSGRELLWTGDLGHEVTYGCILLSSENAETLFNWAEEGVVVEIQP